MLPTQLDYLFVATFQDGSKIHQPKNDASISQPLTRSAFWDVQERGLENLAWFSLTNGRREHFVFLGDLSEIRNTQHAIRTAFLPPGWFLTDGDVLRPPDGLTNFRLIYFRRMQVVTEGGEHHRPEVLSYFIGWQANDEHGRNHQMLLEIPPTGSLEKPTVQRK